jgi:hypothetical protein
MQLEAPGTRAALGASDSTPSQAEVPASAVSGIVVTEGALPSGPSGRPSVHPNAAAEVLVTGRTAAGARIVRRLTTDAKGRFRLELQPGRYAVALRGAPSTREEIVAEEGRPIAVRLLIIGT